MARDFTAEMDALLNHEITEIKVEPADFMDFQKVWVNYDHRKEIVGQAQRDGHVVYHSAESGTV